MKNTIYKYFFYEFSRYFIITLFALASIVWVVQAVNFLDLVTEIRISPFFLIKVLYIDFQEYYFHLYFDPSLLCGLPW